MGPTKNRFFKLDFPSATFWVKIVFLGGWVSEPKDPPAPVTKQTPAIDTYLYVRIRVSTCVHMHQMHPMCRHAQPSLCDEGTFGSRTPPLC